MRSNNVIMIIVAIAMGGGAAYLARSWLQGQLDASAAHQPATHVVIATEPLAYGAALTSDNVTEIPWFAKMLPEGAFASKDDLFNGGRRTVLYPLKQGEPVLRSKVTGPGQRASLAAVLEDGKRAVTVRVDDVRGVAGFVLPGDFVDIVMIADELSSKHQSYSDILLEHVKVLAIDQLASEGEEKPKVAQAVTLEVTKEQAQKILLATNIGKLSLLLGRPIELGSGSTSSYRRAGYRSDDARAGAVGTASGASSRCSGTTAAIEFGEGDDRAKRGDQGVFCHAH